jgi:hypothetical protein
VNQGEPNKGYDIPLTLLPVTDFDAGGVPSPGTVTATNCLVPLPPSEFDAARDARGTKADCPPDVNSSDRPAQDHE